LSALVNSTSTTSTTSPAPLVSTKDTTCNFFPNSNEAEELGRNIVNNVFELFRPILEPVQVNYSSEVLANQINDISILLFMVSIGIMILIVALL
jgi:hypothetical protein